MESSNQLSAVRQGDSRRTSLIYPRSSSSPFTAIALAAASFKAALLGANNNRGGLFLNDRSKYINI